MIISCWCDTCLKQIGCGIFFTFSLNPTSVVFRRWTYLHILKCCVYCLCILSYIHMIIFKNKHSLRKCMHIYTCRHMQMHQRWVGKMINYIFNIDFVLINPIKYFKRQKNECHKYAFTRSCSLSSWLQENLYICITQFCPGLLKEWKSKLHCCLSLWAIVPKWILSQTTSSR